MKPTDVTPEALKNRARVGNPRSCWPWLGHRTEGGYGVIDVNYPDGTRTTKTAHAAMYEAVFGPLDGRQCHHTCRSRSCINPDHLVALTAEEHKRLHVLEDRGRIDADLCGTISRYVGRGCRCEECRNAWRAYWRKHWAANADTINARRRARAAARRSERAA